jgi:cyclohexanecarboxylate-CoA ligase
MVMTFWDLLSTAADECPDRIVLSDGYGRNLTTGGLREAAEQVAAGLHLIPDDVVSWQLPTVLEAFVLMAALARVGAVQNPIIPLLREREIRLITSQLHTTRFVVPTSWKGFEHDAMARHVMTNPGARVIALDLEADPGQQLRLPLGDPRSLPTAPTADSAWRWAYYTSGTTADPKGARHTDRSIIASSLGIIEHLGIRADDVYPIAWPVAHIGGATMLTSVLRAGGRLVLFDTFNPATIGVEMARADPTLLGTALPFFLAYLHAHERRAAEPLYPNLRAFVAGGAPTPGAILEALELNFPGTPVIASWGLTEFPIAASGAPSDPPERRGNTVGRSAPRVRVRVVDGELRLKGPQCFLGYVDSSLDADAFDEDGWFRTGDLGDVDCTGFITITGRLKDVIIRNGENISALEIEEVLLRHPDVADVAVVGIPDSRSGERVCAVIVPAQGRAVSTETVAAHCISERVARQKIPEQVTLVDSITRNAMGKVVKSEIRARVLDGERTRIC